MESRKLASVQRIVSIEPIDGADRIVKATVLGWQCVTQKDNGFKPGDLVVYFEIDSMMPLNNPSFAFLKDPNRPEQEYHRMRTKRFKKQIAQGMILPLSAVSVSGSHRNIILKEPTHDTTIIEAEDIPYIHFVSEGDDLSELLGIHKYEPELPANLRGKVKGTFPYFIPKTDETRIQSAPKVLERRKGTTVVATEKLDGSSFTCWGYPTARAAELGLPQDPEESGDFHFGVASRNMHLAHSEDNQFWRTAEKYELEQRLSKYGRAIALQGEMFGLGIQGNKLNRPTVELRIFNVWDLETKQYLDRDAAKAVAADLGLEWVPELFGGPFVLDHTVDQLVTMSTFKSTLNKDKWAEGMVVRPLEEGIEKDLGRFSFKVINPEFLLKYEE